MWRLADATILLEAGRQRYSAHCMPSSCCHWCTSTPMLLNTCIVTSSRLLKRAVPITFFRSRSVHAFEMFILFGFGAMYGRHDDNDFLSRLAILQNICFSLQVFWFEDVANICAKILRMISGIQTCVVAVCGLLAICIDRKKRRNNYESLGGLVR